MSNPKLVYPDLLRVLAIVGVVLIHITAPTFGEASRIPNSSFWWTVDLINSVTRSSVPIFIMVSGMFLLASDHTLNIKSYVQNRLRRVMPLFFLWSVLYYVWDHRHTLEQMSSTGWLKGFIQNGIHYHLWYVYMIIGLYVIAPPLRVFVKHASPKLIAYTIAACMLAHNLKSLLAMLGISLGIQVPTLSAYIGYFLLGYFLSQHQLPRKARIGLYIGGFAGFVVTVVGNYVLLFPMRDHVSGNYFIDYGALPVVLMASACFVWVKQIDFAAAPRAIVYTIHTVSAATFSVYLSHLIFFELLYEKRPWDIHYGNPLFYVPVVAAFVLVCSIALYGLPTWLWRLVRNRQANHPVG